MSEDLIKRSDAIKAIWGDDINPSEDGMVFEAQSHIDRDIRLIPSADRPQGEWIEHKERTIVRNNNFVDFFPREYGCSNCGLRRATYDINSSLSLTNYCPNCGARMKGADDE